MLLVSVILLIVLLVTFAVYMRSLYEEIYHEYATSKAYADAQEDFAVECNNVTSTEDLRDCFQGIIEAAREPQRAEEDLYAQKQMALWAEIMVYVATFIGIVTIIVAGISAYFLVQANRLNRNALIVSERSWLKITRVALASQFRMVKHETQFGELSLEIHVVNVGKTPALDVQVYAELRSASKWFGDRYAVLRGAAKSAQAGVTTGQIAIFPQDLIPPQRWICRLPDADLRRPKEDITDPEWFKHKLISPILVICTDYGLSFEEHRHQTWEVYSIARTTIGKESGALAIIPVDGDIPLNELEIRRIPVGDTFAN